jgi:hypothetical protein
MPNYPPRRYNRNHKRDRRLHKLGQPHVQAGDDLQRASGAKHEARPEHKCEIEYARFQGLHHRLVPFRWCLVGCPPMEKVSHFSQNHSTINSLTTKSVPKIALLFRATQSGR